MSFHPSARRMAALVVAVFLVAGSSSGARAAVSTVAVESDASVTLDTGDVLVGGGTLAGLARKPRGEARLVPVSVVGADAELTARPVALPGGRALVTAGHGAVAGLWLMGADGRLAPVPIGTAGDPARAAASLEIDAVTASHAVGRWSTGDQGGVWTLDVDAAAPQARTAPSAFPATAPGVLSITSSGRALAVAARGLTGGAIESRILEPAGATWTAPQVLDTFTRFGTDTYARDDIALAPTRRGGALAAWSALSAGQGSVRAARLAPGAAAFDAPATVGPALDETELTPVTDPAEDALVGVRSRFVRTPFVDDVFTAPGGGSFSSVGAGLSIAAANVRGDVLLQRATPSGPAGWAVRTRSGPTSPAVQRDVNAVLGAESGAVVDAAIDDAGDAAALWRDRSRLMASHIPAGHAPVTRQIACGATGRRVALTSGRLAALVSTGPDAQAVVFTTAAGWRSLRLPTGADWSLTQGSTGDLVLSRPGTAVLITADAADGQPVPADGIGCEPEGVTVRATPTPGGDLRVTVRCARAAPCRGMLLVSLRGLPLPVGARAIRVEPQQERVVDVRLAGLVRPAVRRGAIGVDVVLLDASGRILART